MNDLLLLSPILICAATGVLAMVLDLLSGRGAKTFLAYVTTAGFAAAGVAAFLAWRGTPAFAYIGPVLQPDLYASFFAGLILAAAGAAALSSTHVLREHGMDAGGTYALLAFSATGALVLVAAVDLVTLFLGLEVMSLAVYVLAAGKRSSPFSTEAGLKYFVLGGLGSGFLLFGVAMLFGETGSLNLAGVASALADRPAGDAPVLAVAALVLLVVAFGFKVAAVPFHLWTPDVYEGAPTPITGFMAGAVKAAGFGVMARVLWSLYGVPAFDGMVLTLREVLLGLSVLTMVVGNLLGIVQTQVKRILAYSSIAHAGYLLLGLAARRLDPASGAPAVNDGFAFYLFTYVVATVGAFAVLSVLAAKGEEDLSLDKVSGLGRRHPVLAALLLACLLSLAGIPPLAGFMGKFVLFKQVLRADPDGNLPWVIVAVLNSLVALYYYLRIALHLYFREPEGAPAGAVASPPAVAVGVVCAALLVAVGVAPGRVIGMSDTVGRLAALRGDSPVVKAWKALEAKASAAPAVPAPAPAPSRVVPASPGRVPGAGAMPVRPLPPMLREAPPSGRPVPAAPPAAARPTRAIAPAAKPAAGAAVPPARPPVPSRRFVPPPAGR